MSGGTHENTGRGNGPNYGARRPVEPPVEPPRIVDDDTPLAAWSNEPQLPEWNAVADAEPATVGTEPRVTDDGPVDQNGGNGHPPPVDDWSSAQVLQQSVAASDTTEHRPPRRPEPDRRAGRLGPVALVVGAIALLALGAAGYAALSRLSDNDESAGRATLSSRSSEEVVQDIQLLLQGIGYGNVAVEDLDGTIHVTGSVDTQSDVAAVITATASLAEGTPIDTDGLTIGGIDPAAPGTDSGSDAASSEGSGESLTAQTAMVDPVQRLQVLLSRTVAAEPIIFQPTVASLSPWHSDTLDDVAAILRTNPGIEVSVVGYTDRSGSDAENQALSLERAEAVRDYLVGKGVSDSVLQTEARGESEATGIRDVGYLERRVEFEVVAAAEAPPAPKPLDVGIIVPSARDDLAFSQSLVDALNVLNEERGGLAITIADNMFDVDEAKEQARRFVTDGNNVVILHGAQFRPIVEELAAEASDVIFVVGPDPLAINLPNVFVYTIAAEQGAYVLGDMAAGLSDEKLIGVVGPIPAPEPVLFIEGFRQGALAQGADVLVEYTGSFSDVDAASDIARGHLGAGADVLTGTAQLTVGPIEVAEDAGVPWFANQSNQAVLAPTQVVASQVYHLEVAIREILAEIDANATTGGTFPLTLGNGGMLLEFNPNYPLDPALRRRADDLLLGVAAGSIVVDVDVEE